MGHNKVNATVNFFPARSSANYQFDALQNERVFGDVLTRRQLVELSVKLFRNPNIHRHTKMVPPLEDDLTATKCPVCGHKRCS